MYVDPKLRHELDVLIAENASLQKRVLDLIHENNKLKEQIEALSRLLGHNYTVG